MSADEISELRKQLAGKDDILNTMKIKTKEFVQKLKDDHATALSAAEQSLVAATQQLQKKITALEATVTEKDSSISKLEQQNHLLTLSVGNVDVVKGDHAEELKSLQDKLAASDVELQRLRASFQQSEEEKEALKKREGEIRSNMMQLKSKFDEQQKTIDTLKEQTSASEAAAHGAGKEQSALIASLKEELEAAHRKSAEAVEALEGEVNSLRKHVTALKEDNQSKDSVIAQLEAFKRPVVDNAALVEAQDKLSESQSVVKRQQMELEMMEAQTKLMREKDAQKANDAYLLKMAYEENVQVHQELTEKYTALQRQKEDLQHSLESGGKQHEGELHMQQQTIVELKRVNQALQQQYDELSTLFQNLQAEKIEIMNQLNEFKSHTEKLTKDLEKSQNDHIEDCSKLQQDLEAAQKTHTEAVADLQKQLAVAVSDSTEQQSASEEKGQLDQEIGRLRTELEAAQKQHQDQLAAIQSQLAEEQRQRSEECSQLRQQLTSASDQHAGDSLKLKETAGEFKLRLAELSESNAELLQSNKTLLEERDADVSAAVSKVQVQLDALQAAHDLLQTENQEAVKGAALAEQRRLECDQLTASLEEERQKHTEEVTALQAELTTTKDQYTSEHLRVKESSGEYKLKLAELTDACAELQAANKALQESKAASDSEQVTRLEGQVASLQQALDSLTVEYQEAAQTVADLNQQLDNNIALLEASSNSAQLDELQSRLDAAVAELQYLTSAHAELQAAHESANADLTSQKDSVAQLQASLAEAQVALTTSEQQLTETQASNVELKKLLTTVQESYAVLESKQEEDLIAASQSSTKSLTDREEALKKLQSQYDELLSVNQKCESTLSEVQNKFINTTQDADKLQVKYESTRVALEEAQQALSQQSTSSGEAQVALEKQLKSLKEAGDAEKADLQAQNGRTLEELQQLQRLHGEAKAALDKASADSEELQVKLEGSEKECSALRAANESALTNQNSAASEQVTAANKKIGQLQEELSALTAKHAQLSATYKDSLQYKEHADQALNNLKTLYKELQQNHGDLQLKHDGITSTQEQSEQFAKELKARYVALQTQFKEAQAALASSESQLNELKTKHAAEANATSSSSEQLTSQLTSLQQEVQKLTADKSQLDETLNKMKQDSQKEIAALQKEKEKLNKQVDNQEKDLDSLLTQVADETEKFKALSKTHNALSAELKKSNEAAETLSAEKQALMAAHADEVSQLKKDLETVANTLSSVEADGVRRQGEGQGELIILRTDLSSKTQLVATLQSEIQKLQTTLQSMEKDNSQHRSAADNLSSNMEDMMMSLRAKDEQVLSLQKNYEEREKSLKLQIQQLQTTSKNRIAELGKDVDRFSADLLLKNAEIETHKSSSKTITQLNADLTKSLEETKSQLTAEVHRNAEQKKKVRTYLDNLTAENKTLTDKNGVAESSLKELTAIRAVLEQRCVNAESQLNHLMDKSSREIESLRQANHQMECMFENQLGEKDREIQQLLVQVQHASQSSAEEVNSTRARIEESMKEMEAHKSKRLAARNEMIALAKSLERAQSDGNEIKSTVQYNLTPLVLEQVTLLESLVANVEMISFHMTSKKSNTALTNGATLSPRQITDPKESSSNNSKNRVNAFSNVANKNSGGGDGTKNPMNLLELDPESHIPGRPLNRPASSNTMNGISDALVQVETLRIDLERVQMGITLLTLSVEKLKDIVADKQNSGCCGSGGGIFEFLLMGSSGPSLSSSGSYTSNSEGGAGGRHIKALPSSGGAGGGGGGSGSSSRKKLTAMFDAASKAKQGYANLGGSGDNDLDLSISEHKEGGSNFFSIESSMDENDI